MATAADTIMFQGTAIGIFSHQASVSVSLAAATKKIIRATGDWTAGATPVTVGMFVTTEDATLLANKRVCGQILAVTPTDITTDAPLTDAVAATITLRFFKPAALITGFTGPSSSSPRVDVTHSLSTAREYKSGLTDSGTFSFEGNAVRGDAGFIALKQLRNSRLNADFIVADSDRLGFVRFNGGVESIERSGQLDGAVTFSASLFVSGSEVDSELFV